MDMRPGADTGITAQCDSLALGDALSPVHEHSVRPEAACEAQIVHDGHYGPAGLLQPLPYPYPLPHPALATTPPEDA